MKDELKTSALSSAFCVLTSDFSTPSFTVGLLPRKHSSMNLNFRRLLARVAALVLCAVALAGAALAQQPQAPLTNAEFLALVRQLPNHPAVREQLIGEIRRRGINFPLTSGLRAFVSTKSCAACSKRPSAASRTRRA